MTKFFGRVMMEGEGEMKVLVTGGAGFIGSHIVDLLVQSDIQVTILDNLSTGSLRNINPKASFVKKDIRDKDLRNLMECTGFNYVIHQAAQTTVSNSLKNPYYDCDVNIRGLVNLLEASRWTGVKRIIFASSAAIYGNAPILPITEEGEKDPVSFYAESKLTGEHYLNLYQKNFGLEYIALRYANVYGERQGDSGEGGVISTFLNRLMHDQRLTVYGDGKQTRDFIYVKDVAMANYQALFTREANRSCNISTVQETSLRDLIETLSQVCGKQPEVTNMAPRENDIRHSVLDNQSAVSNLNWHPTYTLEEGLYSMLRAYQH